MTVRIKLLFLYFTSIIFLITLVLVINYFNYKREAIYLSDQNLKLKKSSVTAIELNNEFYKNITFDYTYWDEMQNFNANPDLEWAESTLGSMLDAYGIDYVWAYDINGQKQYSTYNEEYSEIINPLEVSEFYNIFDTIENGSKRFISFYMKNDTNFIAIFGATVHSTEDMDRIEKPTGFFFVGKTVDNSYLEKLSIITNCNTTISADTNSVNKNINTVLISCYNPLNDWNNKSVSAFKFEREDQFIKQDRKFKKNSMYLYIVIIVLIIINALIFTNAIISKPIKKIKNSLDNNSTIPILKLSEKKSDEFGQISRLILLFFKQKQNLQTEIEERKSIEEQLKENIEELRQKNEEIHAQTEELYKVNSELEKLSIVASKSENSVIIANSNYEIEYVNEGFLTLYEINLRDWLQQKDKRLTNLSQNPEFLFFIDICKEQKKSEMYTAFNKTFKNNYKWIQTTITPTFDEIGNPEYYILIETDVTQIKNAEDQIAQQNKKIKYSINYASRIQNALFPPAKLLEKTFSQYFIFYQPKEIISGDFYWINIDENITYFAVADCTGHGVPGAFMSILSIAILNDIVNTSYESQNAAQVLEKLRNSIINVLHQNVTGSESKDGLDISLIIIDSVKKELNFAGAHNSLLIFNKELKEIEADKIPVSTSLKMKNFTNKTVSINNGDTYYMFTDGFSDQFGEKTNRKYYKTVFKEYLLKIHEQPLANQKEMIINEHITWKGKLEQVDDILVVGFRF